VIDADFAVLEREISVIFRSVQAACERLSAKAFVEANAR